MALIDASVGMRGVNLARDVKVVQRLLNEHAAPPLRQLAVDGLAGSQTVAGIRRFQEAVVKMRTPDGRVDAGGKTLSFLNRGPQRTPPNAPASKSNERPVVNGATLSGTAWWKANQRKYPNSQRLEDLQGSFRDDCQRFISMLRTAGASISIGSTLRNRLRAHLMHYSWRVSKGEVRARDVPAVGGLDITWDHGDEKASVQGASEMVRLFRMAHVASLTSNHIRGQAIDMNISWTGSIVLRPAGASAAVEVKAGPRNGDNQQLQAIGAGFGVKKLRTDPPHWSYNGR